MDRPISPHATIYKWGPHMLASIIHRITGLILATAGLLTFLWWLAAIGNGEASYATFQSWVVAAGKGASGLQIASNWFFRLLALAVTLSFFQHFFSGLRHLVMDMGAGFELGANKSGAIAVFAAAIMATAAVALYAGFQMMGN